MRFHVDFLSPGSTPTRGSSIQNKRLGDTLRQVTQKQCTTKTSDLVRLFMHRSSAKFVLVVRLLIYFS